MAISENSALATFQKLFSLWTLYPQLAKVSKQKAGHISDPPILILKRINYDGPNSLLRVSEFHVHFSFSRDLAYKGLGKPRMRLNEILRSRSGT